MTWTEKANVILLVKFILLCLLSCVIHIWFCFHHVFFFFIVYRLSFADIYINICWFYFIFVLVSISPLPTNPPPDPPPLERRPSFTKPNQALTSSASSPPPVKDIGEHRSPENPPKSAPLSPVSPVSPVSKQGVAVGGLQDGPVKPKRSAPPPPPCGKLVG